MGKKKEGGKKAVDPATKKYREAINYISSHPLFSPMVSSRTFERNTHWAGFYPEKGYARIGRLGVIYVHPKRHAETEEWIYVFAHCLLHLGMGHI